MPCAQPASRFRYGEQNQLVWSAAPRRKGAHEEMRRAGLSDTTIASGHMMSAIALRHFASGRVCYSSAISLEGNNLLRSSSVLVMLPSLLSSMYARDTACAQRFSYCRFGFVLRKREALLRCRPIDRKRRRRKSCAADYYRSGQSYLAHVRLSFE
jgi:hypothetical protein